MTTLSCTIYKGCTLKTYKNKNGSYTTYIFNGGIKSIKEVTQKYKRYSIELAKIAIDQNEYNFLSK